MNKNNENIQVESEEVKSNTNSFFTPIKQRLVRGIESLLPTGTFSNYEKENQSEMPSQKRREW